MEIASSGLTDLSLPDDRTVTDNESGPADDQLIPKEAPMNPALATPDASRETSDSTDAAARPKIISSEELLQGRRELWIQHGDDMYRLRLTSSGKLYLTK
jgi:hemin uptake protein HemP